MAGLLENTKRSYFKITESGKNSLRIIPMLSEKPPLTSLISAILSLTEGSSEHDFGNVGLDFNDFEPNK